MPDCFATGAFPEPVVFYSLSTGESNECGAQGREQMMRAKILPLSGKSSACELEPNRVSQALLSPADYLRRVENACLERGLRLTPLRTQLLQLIVAVARPIKAYDLLSEMTAINGATAPMTVYRTLAFLVEHGFVHRLESMNAVVGCRHPEVRHSVPFLVCEHCHAAFELEDDQIAGLLDTLARGRGFQPRAQTLEVQGLCASCGQA